MSKWVKCRTKLTKKVLENVKSKELLKQVIKDVVKELCKVEPSVEENYVVTGWGVREKCNIAVLMTHTYGNGFGIKVNEKGELVFVGDTHGIENTYGVTLDKLAEEITSRFIEKAVETALKRMGYTVFEKRETEKGKHLVFVKVL